MTRQQYRRGSGHARGRVGDDAPSTRIGRPFGPIPCCERSTSSYRVSRGQPPPMRQCGHCVCATPRSSSGGMEGSRHQPRGRDSTERAASPLHEHTTGVHRAIGGAPRATSATRRRRPPGPRQRTPVDDPRRWRATGPQPYRGPTAFASCDPRTPEPAQRGAGTRRRERRGSLWVALTARPRPTGELGCESEASCPRKADARTATTLTRGRPPDQRENPQDLRSVHTCSGRA